MNTNLKTILLALLAVAALALTSCGEDDTPAATGSLGFNITGLPAGTPGDIGIAGPDGYSLNVSESSVITGLEPGSYTITTNAVTVDGSPYSSDDGMSSQTVAVVVDQQTEVEVTYAFEGTSVGLRGEWVSAGEDVADILFAFLGTDSIYANFSEDGSYLVESYDTAGVKLTFTGTAVQTASGVGNIFDIVLSQSAPVAATSTGILEVFDAAVDSMLYEVVQTDPFAGTAPTAADGFGSSNGGNLGNTNIQVFRRK